MTETYALVGEVGCDSLDGEAFDIRNQALGFATLTDRNEFG